MKRISLAGHACALLIVSACAAPALPPAATPGPSASAAPAPSAPIALDPAPPPAPSAESLTIDFSSGAAVLSKAALTQLDGAARLYRDARPEVMIVSGHSDKVGSEYQNLLLSAQRAVSVKRALVDRGVPADRLQIMAVGEAEPTPAVVAARAVVVTWR